jgi:sporulation protein YlmC with PRC-barrel domain
MCICFSESLLESTPQIEKLVHKLAKSQSVSKNDLVGKSVIDQNGSLVGKVKDVGFVIGKQGVSLIVEDKNGGTQEFAWEQVQGCVLKPSMPNATSSQAATPQATVQTTQTAQSAPRCPTCGNPLTWIPQYKRWYCYTDQKYI